MMELDLRVPLTDFPLRLQVKLSGPAVAILGGIGSGKTALLESVAGLRETAQGRVTLNERTLMDSDAGVRLPPEARRLGYVPRDVLLFPHLTVAGNVAYGARKGASAQERMEKAVALLELEPLLKRAPGGLSPRERQRVAIARALVSEPALLLLDEPQSPPDAGLDERCLPFLLRVREELKIPMLYATRQHADARLLADEVLALDRGGVSAFGFSREVLAATPILAPRPDNVVVGTLELEEGEARLRVSEGLVLSVPPTTAPAGTRAAYAFSAGDVLTATAAPTEISARNVLRGKVTALETVGAELLMRVESNELPWVARLSQGAAKDLKLAVGHLVFLAIATHSLRPLQ